MNTKPMNVHTMEARSGTKTMLKRMRRYLGCVLLLLPFCNVMAENALEGISYVTGSGGDVTVVLQLKEPLADDPVVFSTDKPARIALDLNNTRNRLKTRKVDIGTGATRRALAVESGGKTRVVVELFKKVPYQVDVDGRTVRLHVGNRGEAQRAVVAAAATDDEGTRVRNIDFRRGDGDEGKVIIEFTDPNATVDVTETPEGVELMLSNTRVPQDLQLRMDVMDFATPVRYVDASQEGDAGRIRVEVERPFEYMAYQTSGEFVLQVKRPEPESEPNQLLSMEEKEYTGDRVSFNFHDMSVRTVLQTLANFTGLNIVVGDSVEGNITLRLIAVPWDQALDIILDAKNLDKRINGNVIWVAPAEEIAAREQQILKATQEKEQLEPLVTDYIQVNYAKARDLADIIYKTSEDGNEQAILSERGSITVDERTNTLLVTDVYARIERVRKVVNLLDRPVEQVMIESRIVVATSDFRKELGVRFGVTGSKRDSRGNILSAGGTSLGLDRMNNAVMQGRTANPGGSGLPSLVPSPTVGGNIASAPLDERLNVNLPVSNPAGSFAFSILAADYLLDLELSAMQEEGRGEVISSPRVITANQQPARISQGQEVAYLEATSSGAASVRFKEIALELNVTPLITPDDRIVLDLDVKKDNIAGYVAGPFNSQVPVIDTRRVTTQVLVNNGETVVLGGIYESATLNGTDKVPLLGDLPGVGNLFKYRLRSNEKQELLIFVTPTILKTNLQVN